MPDLLNDTLDAVANASAKKVFDPCPYCDKREFFSAAQRGSHMFFKHQISGKSANSKAKKPQQAPIVAKKPVSRKVRHESIQEVKPEAPHVAYLVGYITCYIEQYCRGYEIPPSSVTAGVGESLRSQTRR